MAGTGTNWDLSIFGCCGGFSLLIWSVALTHVEPCKKGANTRKTSANTRKTSANPKHETISILQEARVYETSVFGERTFFASLGENSCPEHFPFVTQIYVTIEGPGGWCWCLRYGEACTLDCYWVGSLDLNCLVEIKLGFPLHFQKAKLFLRGGGVNSNQVPCCLLACLLLGSSAP